MNLKTEKRINRNKTNYDRAQRVLLPLMAILMWMCSLSDVSAVESELWQQFKSAKLNGSEPTLPDFSYAGYDYSESGIPDVSNWPVFDVTDYGAVADDAGYDDAAIQAAIDAAEAAGRGVVFFPAGQFMISPTTNTADIIRIQGDNIVLKGVGSDGSGSEVFMDKMKVKADMFEFKSPVTSAPLITTVVANAPRESFEIEVADASGLSAGQAIVLRCSSVPYAEAYFDPLVLNSSWTRVTSTQGFNMNELHTVESINGNTVRLREPLHLPMIMNAVDIDVRAFNCITNVGVEDIRFTGNWASYPEGFSHHKNDIHDYAWGAMKFEYVRNGWVRNCEFKDWNEVLFLKDCAAVTVENILMSGKKGHTSVHVRKSYGVLVKDCQDTAGHHHGCGIGYSNCGAVYLRHQLAGSQRIDSHSGHPYATLMDGVSGGHFDGNGGPYEGFPHHARHFVAWNFDVSGGPGNYNFWPSSRNGHTFAMPMFAGLQGKSITMTAGTFATNESPGTAVEPASLFDAQLIFRLGPTVETLEPSNIGTDSATLNASLISTGRAPSTVRIYWGTSDGGTSSWDNVKDFGIIPTGTLSHVLTDLSPGQTYYYRAWASNSHYTVWARESKVIGLSAPPAVSNQNAISQGLTTAELSGVLSAGGSGDAWICWGTTDGGTDSLTDWDQAVSMGSVMEDTPFSLIVTGLTENATYWYRCYVTNSMGGDWADSAGAFSGLPALPPGTGEILGWSYTNWTSDADSGISNSFVYTAAHCFGDNHGGTVAVNGVAFDEAFSDSGSGWSIGGARKNWGGDDDAAISGLSEDLAEEFIFNGNPRTVQLSGLTPGKRYRTTFFSAGWESSGRWQTFLNDGSGDDLYLDQDHYGNNMGITISYVFDADSSTEDFTITPDSGSLHLYALANREAGLGGVIDNQPPSGITGNSAMLNGGLSAVGATADVEVFWGLTDGGTNAGSWGSSALVGTWSNTNTPISYALTSLAPGQEYYYAFRARIDGTNHWASPSWRFTTPGTAGDQKLFTVYSAHGNPVPFGTGLYASNTIVNASLSGSPIINGTTQYVCTGWVGTGSAGSGSGTNTSFTITTDSTLTWQWQTNYWIDLNVMSQ